jgi:LacI family transcriptional regulator
MKKGTLEDIERLTGYSKTTISRVLNQKSERYRISEAAKIKILRVAQKLDLKLNFVAQSLRNGSSHTIGLVIPYIRNPFFANLASTIISEANNYEYTVMLIDTQENPELETKAIDTMIGRNIDGIILVPCGSDSAFLDEANKTTPIILVDRYFENSSLPYVATDNYNGAFQGMQLLLESGHKNILCIQGPQISITSKERIRGCEDAAQAFGSDINLIIKGNEFSIQNGYIETKLSLTDNSNITAIFALSNTILLGSLEALKENHKKVPQEMSIICFDNNFYLDYLNPPITRVAQPISSIGIAALKMLMQSITEKQAIHSNLLMAPNISKENQ